MLYRKSEVSIVAAVCGQAAAAPAPTTGTWWRKAPAPCSAPRPAATVRDTSRATTPLTEGKHRALKAWALIVNLQINSAYYKFVIGSIPVLRFQSSNLLWPCPFIVRLTLFHCILHHV